MGWEGSGAEGSSGISSLGGDSRPRAAAMGMATRQFRRAFVDRSIWRIGGALGSERVERISVTHSLPRLLPGGQFGQESQHVLELKLLAIVEHGLKDYGSTKR